MLHWTWIVFWGNAVVHLTNAILFVKDGNKLYNESVFSLTHLLFLCAQITFPMMNDQRHRCCDYNFARYLWRCTISKSSTKKLEITIFQPYQPHISGKPHAHTRTHTRTHTHTHTCTHACTHVHTHTDVIMRVWLSLQRCCCCFLGWHFCFPFTLHTHHCSPRS